MIKYISPFLLILPTPLFAQDASVKMSLDFQCIEAGEQGYDTDEFYSVHPTLQDCLSAGGQSTTENENSDLQTQDIEQPDSTAAMPNESNALDQQNNGPSQIMESQNTDLGTTDEENIEDPQQEVETEQNILPGEEGYVLPTYREALNPGLKESPEEIDGDVIAEILELNILGPLGEPLTKEDLTPEKIEELQNNGKLPQDLDSILSQEKTTGTRIFRRGGPEELELPEPYSYSEKPSLFRAPKDYIGRSAKDFLP